MTRRTPLKSNPAKIAEWKRRTARPLPKRGKKVKAWEKERRQLKAEFAAAGITRCQVRLPGCLGSGFLSFAHSLKRRNIQGAEQLREVALACVSCHDQLERLPESEMAATIRSIRRNVGKEIDCDGGGSA